MTVRATIAAWWGAWKWVALLAAALAASLYGNALQWRRAATAPLRAELAGANHALDVSARLLTDAHARAQVLDAAATRTADRLGQAGRDYARARAQRPLTAPQCAPGSARVDATNRALGAKQE